MIFKLSPSSLSLMEGCKRCFWLDKHKVWKRPDRAFPTLPAGMDKVLKIHFDRFRDKGLLPPELCDNKHCENTKLFDNKELLKIWRNNLKGIQWSDKNGNILYGAIDNLLVIGKKFIVLDFKTRGYPIKENTSENYQNQLNIYNFLLRKNSYETEDYSFLLFYYPKDVLKDGEVIFEKELVKCKINIRDAEILFEKAINLLNSECPDKTCDWCERV